MGMSAVKPELDFLFSPSLCGDQDYGGSVHVSWETLGEKYLP